MVPVYIYYDNSRTPTGKERLMPTTPHPPAIADRLRTRIALALLRKKQTFGLAAFAKSPLALLIGLTKLVSAVLFSESQQDALFTGLEALCAFGTVAVNTVYTHRLYLRRRIRFELKVARRKMRRHNEKTPATRREPGGGG